MGQVGCNKWGDESSQRNKGQHVYQLIWTVQVATRRDY